MRKFASSSLSKKTTNTGSDDSEQLLAEM